MNVWLEMNYLVQVWWYDADYFFSLHNYFYCIILLVCVVFIFHLIITKFTPYPLLDYTLYRIVPVYLLQAYKHTSERVSHFHFYENLVAANLGMRFTLWQLRAATRNS